MSEPEEVEVEKWESRAATPDEARLCDEIDRLRAELAEARARCEGLAERVAAQSELLSRRAEKG